ncbi:cytochrome c/FTR1 family iron permease [Ramlibacter sp.]|uniref:cytochrome c/FTR1 family iron permease n=1 Tax=Ramlibacter sp. TaxID=1917967 RepID=UPI002D4921DA|nr:cytochrome c/FTR1 family iron permease [Ramlibacter sp.]HYD77107.1 cytochrome c/FTR1 family iron permease [Ramlibacter sp.]
MARFASWANRLASGWPLALRCLLAALCLQAAPLVHAQSPAEAAPSIIHMLDYVSVDYPEFVQDGKVLDEPEYQEQKEFAARSLALLERLPVKADKPALVAKAQRLLAAIEVKAPGAEVSTLARQVAADVVRIYSVAVAPRRAPDLGRAATLFQQHCASCHGEQGRGDGPAAQGMDPPASNFHDAARMRQRSPYGLYNTITLGVGGTPMRAFTELSDADRWALAFFAAGLRQGPDTLKRGEQLWQQGVGKTELGSLRQLVTAAPGDLAGDDLAAVQAHLLAHPEALEAGRPGALAFTRARLQQALAAYQRGDREGARRDAITAYLEGFELVESSLDNVAPELRVATEKEMMALRHAIDDGQPAQAVAGHVQRIDALIDEAEAKLGEGGLSPQAAFTSSLLILLREGLEAILVLAAIIAFVRKTGRRDAMPWIHAGWIAAALLGAGTWVVSNHVLEITGASREMTEGVSALLAAAMLLYVGAWLHKRSHAQAWQSFIREQVTSALERRTLWAMAGIAFLAVYRELFEVILFYQALWAQAGPDGGQAVLGGMAAGAALLVVLAWVILRFGVRLPIGPFFALTSGLLVVMAVVFVGHGIAALQEAGVLGATPAGDISLPLLGIHPTAQGLLAQGALVAAIAITWLAGRRRAARTT